MLQRGDRFQYQSVVDRYHLRPAYPPAVYRKLFSFVSPESRALDVGCGPGKLTYPLATACSHVDAVDLSPAMIERARGDERDSSRITWIAGDVHTAKLAAQYDLIVAGASIHWMDLDRLFPYLVPHQSARGVVAFVEGDAAVNQPWGREELAVMKATQIAINDVRPAWVDAASFPAPIKDHIVRHPWFVRSDRLIATHPVSQSVDDYIEISFSRQSFALDTMTEAAASAYRDAIREILTPHATEGLLSYEVGVTLEWGTLRSPEDVRDR
jgi:SAM-dependent methyltransferase